MVEALASVMFPPSDEGKPQSAPLINTVLREMLHYYSVKKDRMIQFEKLTSISIDDWVDKVVKDKMEYNMLILMWATIAFHVQINLWTTHNDQPQIQFVPDTAKLASLFAFNILLLPSGKFTCLIPDTSAKKHPSKILERIQIHVLDQVLFIFDTNWPRQHLDLCKKLLTYFTIDSRKIFIPYLLIGELDNQKYKFARNFQENRKVQAAIKWLHEQLNEKKTIEIQSVDSHNTIVWSKSWIGRQGSVNDQQIAAWAASMHRSYKTVVVCTEDFNFKNVLKAHDIVAISAKEFEKIENDIKPNSSASKVEWNKY